MASHKSPSGQRWVDRRESRDILATRRARSQERRIIAKYGDEYDGRGYESAGHYHWRLLHKNLAKPVLRTRNVKIVEPAVWTNG